jgi:hypothetical protein
MKMDFDSVLVFGLDILLICVWLQIRSLRRKIKKNLEGMKGEGV